MPRDNRAGSSSRCSAAREPILSRCALRGKSHRTIDPHASKNPRPAGAESTLTENASSPFHAEPRHPSLKTRRRFCDTVRHGQFVLVLVLFIPAKSSVRSWSASLRTRCRCPLHRVRRSHRDQGYTDDDQHSHAPQVSAIATLRECRHRHNSGVSETRPCCEGDQAAIGRRVTRCYQQENAECDIEAKHHIKGIHRLILVP